MNVHIDLCIVPMGVGVSVSRYIVACHEILDEHDLSHTLHAYGTNIEGDFDTVFQAIKACHEKVHAMGAPRITTSIKLGTRVDREQSLRDKVESVETKRKKPV
ncbi:MAG: MTH1187 family thiamine-binding protein [Gammaproteobacteria bacterium]|nr:MTH1187 family thiamine-binding protein [Gammaproteobacteria bacterium]